MACARFYSGPSRTVEVVRRLSADFGGVVSRTVTFSRNTTLDREGGVESEKPRLLAGLGRKISRNRQGSGQDGDGGNGGEGSGAITPLRKEVEAAELQRQISGQVLEQMERERGRSAGVDAVDHADRARREEEQAEGGQRERQRPAMIRAPLTG